MSGFSLGFGYSMSQASDGPQAVIPPVLAGLMVSPATAKVGQAYLGTVVGKTAGSVLSLSGAGSAGLSVSGSEISGTPTASGEVDIEESLADAANSPRVTHDVIVVSSPASNWILATGVWNDAGVWDDAAKWKDAA